MPGGIRIPNLLILSFLLALLGEWVGTATQLWEKLGDLAGGRHAEASGLAEEYGRAVSGQLKRIAPNLWAQGVMVNWLPRTSGRRQIQILRTETGAQNSVTTVTPSPNSTRE